MKINKKTIPAGMIIVVTGVFLPINAQAEDIPARGPIPFAAFDKDDNGLISEEEFNSVRGQRISTRAAEGRSMSGAAGESPFSRFDTNADGQLNQDELAAGRMSKMEQRRKMGMGQGGGMGQGRGMGPGREMGKNMPAFSDCDLDGDGKIPEKEFNEARAKRISERAKQGYPMRNSANAPPFSDIDTNADGAISEEEFTMHQVQHRQQMQQRRDMRMGPDRGMHQGMNPRRGMGRNMPAFSEFDLDGDGKIPEKEFNEARANRRSEREKQGYPMRNSANAPPFSNIDTNSDGVISEEEFTSSQSQHRQQMQQRREMRMAPGRGMHQGMDPRRGMGRHMPAFSEFDLDGDGKMSEKEFNEARSKRITERTRQGYQMRNIAKAPSFSDIDTNADGVISPEEFTRHQSLRRQQRAQ